MKIIAARSFIGLFEKYEGNRVITRCVKLNGMWFLYLSQEFIDNREFRK